MPRPRARSRKEYVRKRTEQLIHEGYDAKQAYAIANNEARKMWLAEAAEMGENVPMAVEESPTREPWVVMVRTSSPEEVERKAGMRGLRSPRGVSFALWDDERAASLARTLTRAGYLVTYGPENSVAAEAGATEDCDHSHPPSVPTKPCHGEPEPENEDEQKVIKQYLNITDGAWGKEVRLADLRMELHRMPRDRVDAVLHKLRSEKRLNAYPIENYRELTKSDKEAALKLGVTEHHYIKIFAPSAKEASGMPPKERKHLEMEAWKMVPKEDRGTFKGQRTVISRDGSVVYVLSTMSDENLKAFVYGYGHASQANEAPFASVERDPKVVDAGKKLGTAKDARAVYDMLQEQLNKESQEVFLVIPVDLHGDPVCPPVEVARGQRDRVSVDTSDVLRPVIAHNASGFVVVHNHPSGHAKPSDADRQLTKTIQRGTKPFEPVVLIDHVIVGRREYYSILEDKYYKVK